MPCDSQRLQVAVVRHKPSADSSVPEPRDEPSIEMVRTDGIRVGPRGRGMEVVCGTDDWVHTMAALQAGYVEGASQKPRRGPMGDASGGSR